jgi:hypothetical protein
MRHERLVLELWQGVKHPSDPSLELVWAFLSFVLTDFPILQKDKELEEILKN